MQAAIESFGQQLTQKFNIGDKAIIMNGFQCYLKRMEQVIRNEVQTSQVLGYNLGVKLIRGAYMNEERALAKENNYESPVWDSIEDTHTCYNKVMNHVIDNIRPNSRCIIASHNVESCEMAIDRMKENDITDYRVRFG